MKPRVFLGSSVEGLSVAYSIQANLMYIAEMTVWSQGVFELSKTTIESLFEILNRVDFGVFVFTPDDLVKIRDNSSATVRDNVLFEFGLFLGKLGRERVFFIIPSDNELHLPTDLLGITPAKYESSREDGNLQAATGAACHQVSGMIKKCGPIHQIEETSNTPDPFEPEKSESTDWIGDFLFEKYQDAICKLEIKIKDEVDEKEIVQMIVYKGLCEYRLDEKNIGVLEEILLNYQDKQYAYLFVAEIFRMEDFVERAIQILEEAKVKFGNSVKIIELLAECHLNNENSSLAIECFRNELTYSDPIVSIKFASIYIEDKDFVTAREILHRAYLAFPNNKALLKQYATVAGELKLHKLELFFYDKLISEEPQNVEHLGYLGNSCLNLNLNDIALINYQKANELSDESQEWILSNLGNILKNRGFHTEGIKYLKKALEKNETSEYALDRLSTSLKFKDEELKEYKRFVKEGKKSLIEYSGSLALNISTDDNTSIISD